MYIMVKQKGICKMWIVKFDSFEILFSNIPGWWQTLVCPWKKKSTASFGSLALNVRKLMDNTSYALGRYSWSPVYPL